MDERIELIENVADFTLDGFEIETLNHLLDRLERGNLVDGGIAVIQGEEVRHYTYRNKLKNKTCSVFYRFGNDPVCLSVYAIGKHTGDNNQDYKLITFADKKEARYTFNPHHKDPRYNPLYS